MGAKSIHEKITIQSDRVYFGVNGIGSGHIRRSLHIAHELKKKGVEIAFSTYNDPAAINLIQSEGFQVAPVGSIGWIERADGTINVERSIVRFPRIVITLLKQVVDEVRNIIHFDPDIVVSDARLSTIAAAKILRRKVILINHVYWVPLPKKGAIFGRIGVYKKIYETILNLFLFFLWQRANYHMVPDFPPPAFLSTETLRLPKSLLGRLQFIGAVLPENTQYSTKQVSDNEQPINIFVVIGGTPSARSQMTRIVMDIIEALPEYHFTVTLGNPSRRSYVKRKKTNLRSIELFGWINDPHEYFKNCDVIIARPGHNTVTEGILHGKPILMFPIKNHGEYIAVANKIENLGVGIKLLDEDFSVSKIRSIMNQLLSSKFRNRSRRLGSWARQYNGLATAVQAIMGLLDNLKRNKSDN